MQFLSPSWWLIIVGIVLIAASYAVLVQFNKSEVNKQLKWLVWCIRSVAIAFIIFLLAQPVFEINTTTLQKPHLYVAFDVSASVEPFENDVQQIKKELTEQQESLQSKYEVHQLNFGQQIQQNSSLEYQQVTNYSALAKHIEAIKSGDNNQLVVVSDGIFNQGINPLYDSKWNYPVHTIAVGDTSVKKDLFIQEIRSNKSVFKGNELPVNINVVAELMQGETVGLIITEQGKVLFEEKITINKPSLVQDVVASVKLKTAGEHKLEVTLKTSVKEPKANNVGVFYVTVQETKKRIVCIAEAPHPDVRMLVNAWNKIPEYEVLAINSFERIDTLTFSTIDLLVLHKPSTDTWNKLGRKTEGVPTWWITGMSPKANMWNNIPTGIALKKASNQVNEISFAWNTATNVFNLSTEEITQLANSAPVQVPFGEFVVAPSTQIIVYQKVGNLQTNYPLISVNTINGVKHGAWVGEGFWKWQLNTFEEGVAESAFEQLALKYTRLLLTKENKKPLVCYAPTSINEGEKWKLTANVFNTSFERTNEAEVQLALVDSAGNEFTFDPIVNGNDYQFLVSGLATGAYTYEVTALLNNKKYIEKGNILVKTLNLEQFNTKANFDLLRAWSVKTQGVSVTKENTPTLITDLLNSAPAIQTTNNKEQKLLLDLWYILLIPVLLIGTEWLIRKRNGMN